jgi:FtsP/CotA-like multicopper oxidase with cupredoxin domain
MGQGVLGRASVLAAGGLLAAGLLALGLLAGAGGVRADKHDGPCAYKPIDIDKYGGAKFANPEVIRAQDGVLRTTLKIAYAEHTIADCPVSLRNYNGRLVGPTLRVKPGDTLVVALDNSLPPNAGPMPDDPNVPHGFNTTNLHTHGLHVSPVGNSDNVLLSVAPGERWVTEIKIPADHPPGTFWYHAHVHGSTALQVSSGMAGALIIEGGLDDVPAIAEAADKVFVFQQIAYNEKGVIESYDDFGPGGWQDSHRQTLINGQLVPTITMRPGEVQRWRFIHAGIRETIQPVLKTTARSPEQATVGGYTATALARLRRAAMLDEIAVDGLALGRIDSWDAVELQPGYRSDVMVRAPRVDAPTLMVLTDGMLAPSESLLGAREPERVLARVVVEGEPVDMALPTDAEVAELAPHAPITDAELTGQPQTVVFNIDQRVCPPGQSCRPCAEDEPGCKTRFMINARPFSLDNVRELKLGTASEWTLSSLVASHPFHIHVNPFQVTRVGPDGNDQIVWRDTLFVRQGADPVKVRSRYSRYIGKFVIHCHILDHEDQGMMQVVEIVN